MDTLFTEIENEVKNENAPLAVRMRPRVLDDLVGQEKALGKGTWLRSAIENDSLSSVILYGPAGTGKTSLSRVIAHTTHAHFVLFLRFPPLEARSLTSEERLVRQKKDFFIRE